MRRNYQCEETAAGRRKGFKRKPPVASPRPEFLPLHCALFQYGRSYGCLNILVYGLKERENIRGKHPASSRGATGWTNATELAPHDASLYCFTAVYYDTIAIGCDRVINDPVFTRSVVSDVRHLRDPITDYSYATLWLHVARTLWLKDSLTHTFATPSGQ